MRKVNTLVIKTFCISFLAGFSCVLIMAHCLYKEPVIKLVPYVDPNYVQTPTEAQQRLKRQGYYHGEIDGIWGAESQKAHRDWEKEFCDQCAIKEFEQCQ